MDSSVSCHFYYFFIFNANLNRQRHHNTINENMHESTWLPVCVCVCVWTMECGGGSLLPFLLFVAHLISIFVDRQSTDICFMYFHCLANDVLDVAGCFSCALCVCICVCWVHMMANWLTEWMVWFMTCVSAVHGARAMQFQAFALSRSNGLKFTLWFVWLRARCARFYVDNEITNESIAGVWRQNNEQNWNF